MALQVTGDHLSCHRHRDNFLELNRQYETAYPRKTYGVRLRGASLGKFKQSSADRRKEITMLKGVDDVILANLEVDTFSGLVTMRIVVDFCDYNALISPWPNTAFIMEVTPESIPLEHIQVLIVDVDTSLTVDPNCPNPKHTICISTPRCLNFSEITHTADNCMNMPFCINCQNRSLIKTNHRPDSEECPLLAEKTLKLNSYLIDILVGRNFTKKVR